ncbi:MAG: hypothetical protein ACE5GQ_04540 [Nitrospinales bacterium]
MSKRRNTTKTAENVRERIAPPVSPSPAPDTATENGKPNPGLPWPDKESYTVSEMAGFLANKTRIGFDAARRRVYRGIATGKLDILKYLGSTRIPRGEVLRVLRGEEI